MLPSSSPVRRRGPIANTGEEFGRSARGRIPNRTPPQVPPAPRARGGGTEGETRRRRDGPPSGRGPRPRGPPRRATETRGRSLVRSDRPAGRATPRGGWHLAPHRDPRNDRGGRRQREGECRGPGPYGPARPGQQAGNARGPFRRPGLSARPDDAGLRDAGDLLGPSRGSPRDAGKRKGAHYPWRTESPRVHVRRTTHLGLHLSNPRGTPRLRRPQRVNSTAADWPRQFGLIEIPMKMGPKRYRLRRGSKGTGLWRARSSPSGSSTALIVDRPRPFPGRGAEGFVSIPP